MTDKQTFDQWYQSEAHRLDKPSAKLYEVCHNAWREIQRRGQQPTTAKIIGVLVLEPLRAALEMFGTLRPLIGGTNDK